MFKDKGTLLLNLILYFTLYAATIGIIYLAITKDFIPTDNFAGLRRIVLLLFVPILLKYLLHLLIAPWYPLARFLHKRKYRSSRFVPSVSVLIPAYNEEVGIRATIKSAIETNYPNLEIIIIDDGSTDKTAKIIKKFISDYKKDNAESNIELNFRTIPNGGKAKALNTALAISTGEIIVTIDADSVMDQRAIKKLVKYFTNPKVASVAGNVAIGNRSKFIGIIQQLEYLYGFYFKRADSMFNAVYIVGGAAAAYRSKIIRDLGGFDEDIITEDIELSTRLQYHGYHVRYAADAIVYTEGPSDFNGLFKQRLRWKYGRLITFYKYKRLFFSINKKHNKYLTFIILPIALFAEFLLLFELPLLIIFFSYTFISNDYNPLAFVIILITAIISLQIVSDPQLKHHRRLFMIAPVAWLLFYVMDFIELLALVESIKKLVTKSELAWQRWKRIGVFE